MPVAASRCGPAAIRRSTARWRWLSLALPADLLVAALAAGTKLEAPHDGVLLVTPRLAQVLRAPCAETQLHVGAGVPFGLLWAAIMRDIVAGPTLRLKASSGQISFNSAEGFTSHLLAAATVRLLLASFLRQRELNGAVESFDVFLQTHLPTIAAGVAWGFGQHEAYRGLRHALCLLDRRVLVPPIERARRLYQALSGRAPARGKAASTEEIVAGDPLARWLPAREGVALPEVRFACRALRYLAGPGSKDASFALAFWQYERIRCATHSFLVEEPGTAGLDWFTRHYARISPLRGTLTDLTYSSALELQSRDLHLGALEARTAPDSSWTGVRDEVRGLARQARRFEPLPARGRPEVGLIFHFIKEWEHSLPRGKKRLHADPRHLAFGCRFGLWFHERMRQAAAIEAALHHNPELLLVLRGIDVANVEPAEARLDDLLWELERYRRREIPAHTGRLEYVRAEAMDIARMIYDGRDRFDLDDLVAARALRHQARMLERVGYPFIRQRAFERTPAQLFYRYLTDPAAFDRGQRPIEVVAEETETIMLRAAQRWLRGELGKREITVEANSSSNLLIADYLALEEHAMFRLQPLPHMADPEGGSVLVSVNTDNPVTFASTLADEFAHIYFALLGRGVRAPQARDDLSWSGRVGARARGGRFTGGEARDPERREPAIAARSSRLLGLRRGRGPRDMLNGGVEPLETREPLALHLPDRRDRARGLRRPRLRRVVVNRQRVEDSAEHGWLGLRERLVELVGELLLRRSAPHHRYLGRRADGTLVSVPGLFEHQIRRVLAACELHQPIERSVNLRLGHEDVPQIGRRAARHHVPGAKPNLEVETARITGGGVDREQRVAQRAALDAERRCRVREARKPRGRERDTPRGIEVRERERRANAVLARDAWIHRKPRLAVFEGEARRAVPEATHARLTMSAFPGSEPEERRTP